MAYNKNERINFIIENDLLKSDDAHGVLNLGYNAKKSKINPLADFEFHFTNNCPCILDAKNSHDDNVTLIKAKRKNDKLCIALCDECINNLFQALKMINQHHIYYENEAKIKVYFKNSFNEKENCYFCGFNDLPCYDIYLNKIRLTLCSHCRERAIILLNELAQRKKSHNKSKNI